MWRGFAPGATAAELAQLERGLAHQIPSELRELLTWHNGQEDKFIGYFEQHWRLMGTDSIVAGKKELDAEPPPGWQKAWIPFLDDDGGDYLCLDASDAPALVRGFYVGNDQHEIVAPSFAAWLADFVEHIEKGQYEEDPERGTFDRH